MKQDIVFDSSTLISIATNNLLWVLPKLKDHHQGTFYITEAVKKEIINVPLHSRRFKLEAVQIIALLSEGVLTIAPQGAYLAHARTALEEANSIFSCKGNSLKLIQEGELQSLLLARELDATLAVDERTTRLLLEDPESLRYIMQQKLHCPVPVNLNKLHEFTKAYSVPIIRSTELMLRAYELGILDRYLNKKHALANKINLSEELLDGLLWGLRLRGCAISTQEIEHLKKYARHS